MLVANRFSGGFSDVETEATTTDSDPDTVVITATNTTSVRLGELPSTPVLAMTGQSTVELDEWVDVSNYEKIQMLFWFYARRNQANVESDRFQVLYATRTTTNGEGTWIALETYQRGKGRFRRNNRWYLAKVIISTPDFEAVNIRLQSFYPTSTKMVLLDKFGILGFEKEEVGMTNDVQADGADSNHNSLSKESQQRGVPNRSVSIDPIRGKSTNLTDDDGSWWSHPKELQQRGDPKRSDSLQPIRGKSTNISADDVAWLSRPLV
ncbi:MAG: hypothetical protein SGBAC_008818 [Bacillariaceae sp.]